MPRIRVIYEKLGWIVFVNHMDLPTVFSRAARRAELSQEFTQGFSPHPRMRLGPALSIGVEGHSEVADFWFNEWDETSMDKWNMYLPEGIKILRTYEVDGPALAKSINGAVYTIVSVNLDLDEETLNILEEAIKINGTLYASKLEDGKITIKIANLEKNTPSYFVRTLVEKEKCSGWSDLRFTRDKVGFWDEIKQDIIEL